MDSFYQFGRINAQLFRSCNMNNRRADAFQTELRQVIGLNIRIQAAKFIAL